MPSINLCVTSVGNASRSGSVNHLPQLLHTPAGLAILEIQGTLHTSQPATLGQDASAVEVDVKPISIGRLEFPFYNSQCLDPKDTAWMKRVYLYVGRHQRMTGEVKKLAKPVAVISKQGREIVDGEGTLRDHDELQVADIIRYKIVFASRPEPVGG